MGVGRPLKFGSVQELQEKIDNYFNNTKDEELTITGLALALDTSRKVLVEYEEKSEYSNTIKKAKDKIEESYERSLRKYGRTGDIFALKNFGWKDKQEIEADVNATVDIDIINED